MHDITIRRLHSPQHMHALVELQKEYWGEDADNLVPGHMLLSLAAYSGLILGAYEGDSDTLVGGSIGFIGTKANPDEREAAAEQLVVMSKRAIVSANHQGKGIGEALKRKQYDIAAAYNIKLVIWTFDPLLSRNAYFNLHKLGAVGQQFILDPYASVTSANAASMSGDRIVAHWWVRHPHVTERGKRAYHEAAQINQTAMHNGLLTPTDLHDVDAAQTARLQIPADFADLQAADAGLAQAWRSHVRQGFQHMMQAGYIVTDFWRHQGHSYYVFTPDDGSFAF
jgi:chorismate synthase